jgi:hypothetical protein
MRLSRFVTEQYDGTSSSTRTITQPNYTGVTITFSITFP